jgi:ribosomal protein S18 acetylase RimI-like enzyme
MGIEGVKLEQLGPENVGELEKINLVLFPIKYPPNVYRDIVACASLGVSYLAVVHSNSGNKTVGGISCRLEKTEIGPVLYIITLGVLAPYRNAGLGSELLGKCLATVKQELPEVVLARLHVQVSNIEGIKFYKKHGFEIVETIENYYRKTEPRHAVLLDLKLKPS